MKKALTIIVCAVLLVATCLSFGACSSSKETSLIDFDKKYLFNESNYYVFRSDGTGFCEYKDVYTSPVNSSYNYTLSGRIEFVWREASDGAVYLFRVKTDYHEDHTEGRSIPLITQPIYFSEDFFAYTHFISSVGTTTTPRYIKEGSELQNILNG